MLARNRPFAFFVAGLLLAVGTAMAGDAWLGVTIEEATDHPEGGALVTSVLPESPASEAGLEAGDIVVGVDTRTIRGPGALSKSVRSHAPGDQVELSVVRDGRQTRLAVELGERETSVLPHLEALGALEGLGDMDFDFDFDFEDVEGLDLDSLHEKLGHLHERLESLDGPFIRKHVQICKDGDCHDFNWLHSDRPLLGVQLLDTTPELRSHLGADEADDRGMLVGRVTEDSVAEQAGVRVGDLLVTIGGQSVGDAHDVRRALADMHGERVELEVVRDGAMLHLEADFPEKETDDSDSALPGILGRTDGAPRA